MTDTTQAADPSHLEIIAQETGLAVRNIAAVAKLLADGATVPFIARYRKETTGSLDEVQIQTVRDRLQQLVELDSRRVAIVKSLDERGLLGPELKAKLIAAGTLQTLEDLFAPFRPKRQTRATKARDRGLEPLAEWLLVHQDLDPADEASKYVDPAKEVAEVAEALAGARDIIAERVAESAELRGAVRQRYQDEANVTSRRMYGKEDAPEAAKFRDYFEWSEPLKAIPSHRMLAIRRGEQEGVLIMRVDVPLERVVELALPGWVVGHGPAGQQVRQAVEDGCKRLLVPSMETEMRLASKKAADTTAIRVFADNLRELLLASPLGRKRLLAIDPAFRTGCKTVVLDAQGALLHHTVLHATAGSSHQIQAAGAELLALVQQYKVEAVAIGNGTGSRETEAFVRGLGLPSEIPVIMVNEAGASVYSASEVAREEFPDHDVTVRGAVSIGRRAMDPLAELVKLDPKVIGVGQYQHDVEQRALKASLDDTVVSCVNAVGVELNTASKQLLAYVSGLSPALADNIVAFRREHGGFRSREDLKKVSRLGPKTFEQAAGFLRVHGGAHALDASAVHPERYAVVERMAADVGCDVARLIGNEALHRKIKLEKYVDADVGLPTLQDILAELAKPGRDPRKQFEVFAFAEGVAKPADLKPGMKLPGLVTNVTAFGAFVDVGVHQDGLVHVSQLADRFIRDPNEAVKVGQKVQVTVLEVDLARNRISLTMRTKAQEPRATTSTSDPSPRNRQGSAQPQQKFANNEWFKPALKQTRKR